MVHEKAKNRLVPQDKKSSNKGDQAKFSCTIFWATLWNRQIKIKLTPALESINYSLKNTLYLDIRQKCIGNFDPKNPNFNLQSGPK
jgi:hypothetical protein